ncbi:MAG TPA: sulfate ABC transporter substrate-binding protein [Nitrosospira sp.]|nr:sulfate ABC transporter substrate-binding protein [Nitrosospira sp.]
MLFNNSRFAVGIFIALASLGVAYATLSNFPGRSPAGSVERLYEDLNAGFASLWKARTGLDIKVEHALSKSGKPVHITVDGLYVPSLALSYDVDKLHDRERFIAPGARELLAQDFRPGSLPSAYTSTIVFLVRKGNPKELRDWSDLVRPDIKVVTPNPKRSENGRWNYLAAWGSAMKQSGGSEQAAREFVGRLFANAQIVDYEDGKPQDQAVDFISNGVGDVFLIWENEAHLIVHNSGNEKFEIVTPSISIVAEPVISVVDTVARGKDARGVGASYIEYLYTPQAQHIAAQHYYRPRDPSVGARYEDRFPHLELFTVDEVAGGWQKAQKIHFANGGVFDRIAGDKPASVAENGSISATLRDESDG